MPSGGIPKLRLLVTLQYIGVAWASPSLGFFHPLFHSPSNLYPKLENFTTQNSTGNLISSVSERKQNHHIRYCNELVLYLYWCETYCIPSSLWFIPLHTSHRCIKISKQHTKNRICQKQNSLQKSVTNANFWNFKNPIKIGSPGKKIIDQQKRESTQKNISVI